VRYAIIYPPMHLGPEDIQRIIVGLITLVLSICVHEFGHAIVADKLGDSLPRRQGRVTLNPLAHADPIGTLAFPLFFMIFTGSTGFGWGRPVQVQPAAMTRKLRMRTAHMLVAAAGPAMNIVLAFLVGLVTTILLRANVIDISEPIYIALLQAMLLNCILAVFNLIPAPPLDGGTVLEGFLPTSALPTWHRIAQYGPIILFAFIFLPPLQRLIYGPSLFILRTLCGLFGLPA
jgi:Zn-dependent protease